MSTPAAEMPEDASAQGRGLDRFLLFDVCGRALAVPIGPVLEVIEHRDASPVPYADPRVEGILPLRGRMVTVVDVRRGLGLPPRQAGSKAKLIVIESSGDLLGLVVDEVTRVAGLPEEVAILDPGGLLKGMS